MTISNNFFVFLTNMMISNNKLKIIQQKDQRFTNATIVFIWKSNCPHLRNDNW